MIFAKFALGLDEVSTSIRLCPLKDKMTKCKIRVSAGRRVPKDICEAKKKEVERTYGGWTRRKSARKKSSF